MSADELDPAWVAEVERGHREHEAWLRELAAVAKANGEDEPIDRDALRKRLRAAVAQRLEVP